MADPKYAGDKASYQDALAAWRAQEALESEQGKATAESTKAQEANLGVRKSATAVVTDQATALEAVSGALQRETALLNANTAAWTRSAEARRVASGASAPLGSAVVPTQLGAVPGGGTRYEGTQVGYSDALAQFKAQQAAVERAAAADAAAAGATQAAASRGGPGLYEQLLARQRTRQQITEAALEGRREPLLLGSGTTFTAPSRGPAIPTTAERAPTPNYDQGLGAFGPAQATKQDLALIDAQNKARASLAGVGGEIEKTNALWRVSVAETAAASQAMVRHGALSAEFIQSLARGEVTLSEFGSALTTTIGKFAGWAVAGGLVYTAFEALKQVARGATDTATGVARLERVQLPNFNRGEAEAGFRRAGARLNVPISEVSEAQFYAARSGFNRSQKESLEAGETAVLAQKLDNVPIQEAARGLGAIRVAFNLNAEGIRRVFNELDVGQLKFNARLQQTLPYLGRSASAFAASGGTVEQLTRQIVTLTGAVPGGGGGGGSGSAATFFTREPGNLRKASSEEILRQYGFDPRTPVGKLNEEIQKAVLAGRTPSGARIEAATPGQQQPLTNAQQVLYKLAEAASGGPALAGRYGVQLFSAGQRQEQINKELAKSEGAAGEDLKAKLGQFDEQFSAIGYTFERVGSEIGESGATSALEDVLSMLKKVGEGAALVAGPLANVGNIFSSLPTALQDILVLGGLTAGASRFGGFNALASSADRDYVNAARRTTSEGLTASKGGVERRTRELQSLRQQELGVLGEQARFASGEGRPLVTKQLRYDDPRSIALQQQANAYDERLTKIRSSSNRTQEQLITEQELKLRLEQDEALINDRRVQVSQKAQILRGRGVVVAQGGLGSSLPLIGGEGELVGSAYAARENLAQGAGTRFLAGPAGGAAITEDLDRTAIGIREGGAAVDGSLATVARINTEGAVGLGDALKLSGVQVRDGGIAVAEGLKAAAVAIGTAAVAPFGFGAPGSALRLGEAGSVAKGGLGDIIGGVALGAGSLGSRIGQNALKGVMYAFIGSAVGELLGEGLGALGAGKGVQSGASGIGGDIGLGAAIGTFIEPGIGTALGAGAGAVGGLLDQIGLFGGGSKAESDKTTRLKAEKQAAEEGADKNAQSIEGQRAEFAQALEDSFSKEGEAAQHGSEKVAQVIKNLSAQVAVFGANTPQGQQASAAIASAGGEAFLKQFEVPTAQRAVVSDRFQEALQATNKAANDYAKNNLPFAATPKERQDVLKQASQPGNELLQEVNTEAAKYNEEIKHYQSKLSGEQQQQGSLPKAQLFDPLKGELRGLAGERLTTTPGNIASAIADDTAKLNELRSKVKEIGPAKQQLERSIHDLEGLSRANIGIKEETDEAKSKEQLRLQEEGGDTAAKRKTEDAYRQTLAHIEGKKLPFGVPGKKEFDQGSRERQTEAVRRQQEGVQENLKEVEARGAREIAQLPAGASQSQIAAVRQRVAAAKLAVIRRNEHNAFGQTDLLQAEAALDEAGKSRAQAVENEASELASLQGQIREASDVGNVVAQANDAIGTANTLLGLAKNEKERLQATLQLINAEHQLHQAQEEHIAALGGLRESEEVNPAAKTATKIGTLRKQLASAKGPDERIKYRTDLNNEIIKQAQEASSEKQSQIDFELHVHKITNDQAIRDLQGLLKKKDLTRAARRQIESHIYDLENETQQDFNVGNIRQPTLYGARTLRGLIGGAATPTNAAGFVAAPPTAPPIHLEANITIVSPDGHKKSVHKLHRVAHTVNRAHARSAGQR